MKTKKVYFNLNGKKFKFDAEICEGLKAGRGLMFKSKNTNALLFEFDNQSKTPLTSLFVFFPFVAVWLDGERIVDIRLIKPFKPLIRTKKRFNRILEIPVNHRYKREIKFLCSKPH